ncbi:MAG: pilin [Pontibacterium sp.]
MSSHSIAVTRYQQLKGFTLIELIVVIALLGILAAIALPRFLNVTDKAELASIEATAGAFKTAVVQVNTAWKLNGHKQRVQNLGNFGDGLIDTNDSGFPLGTDKGSGNENIGRQNKGCVELWNGLLQSPPSVSLGADADFQAYRHTGNKMCSYAYRKGGDQRGYATAALVIQYDSRVGDVWVCGSHADLSSCP